ncbi:hypothetical protein OROHE_005231 [Orobanche hederae]
MAATSLFSGDDGRNRVERQEILSAARVQPEVESKDRRPSSPCDGISGAKSELSRGVPSSQLVRNSDSDDVRRRWADSHVLSEEVMDGRTEPFSGEFLLSLDVSSGRHIFW